MINKFLDSMDEGIEYDFISRFYNEMTKTDLKNILLEYIYAVHYASEHAHTTLTFEEDVREQVRGELESHEVFG